MLISAMLSGATAYTLHVLHARCAAADEEIRRAAAAGAKDKPARTTTAPGGADLAHLFNSYCTSAVRTGMLPAARGSGFASLRVRYRDHGDRFNTVGELLQEINARSGSTAYTDLVRLVRMFYQLEYSLDADPALGNRVLAELERRIVANDGTRQVGSIERVARGQRCDTQKMTPVRSGSYVEQPLGFVIYSPENKVMARAEVLCR